MTQDNDGQSSGPDDTGATEPRPEADGPQAQEPTSPPPPPPVPPVTMPPPPVQLGKPERPQPSSVPPPPSPDLPPPPPPAPGVPPASAVPPIPDYPPVPDYPPAPDYPPPPPFGDSNGTPPPAYPPAKFLEPPYTYDQPPPGSAPYGTPSYGTPAGAVPPAYGSPGYTGAAPNWTVRSGEASSLRTQAIVSLVLNLLAVVSCCNLLAIGGAVCAGSAIGKVDSDYPRARSLVRWSWGLFAGGFALAALGFVGLVTLGYFSDATTG